MRYKPLDLKKLLVSRLASIRPFCTPLAVVVARAGKFAVVHVWTLMRASTTIGIVTGAAASAFALVVSHALTPFPLEYERKFACQQYIPID